MTEALKNAALILLWFTVGVPLILLTMLVPLCAYLYLLMMMGVA